MTEEATKEMAAEMREIRIGRMSGDGIGDGDVNRQDGGDVSYPHGDGLEWEEDEEDGKGGDRLKGVDDELHVDERINDGQDETVTAENGSKGENDGIKEDDASRDAGEDYENNRTRNDFRVTEKNQGVNDVVGGMRLGNAAGEEKYKRAAKYEEDDYMMGEKADGRGDQVEQTMGSNSQDGMGEDDGKYQDERMDVDDRNGSGSNPNVRDEGKRLDSGEQDRKRSDSDYGKERNNNDGEEQNMPEDSDGDAPPIKPNRRQKTERIKSQRGGNDDEEMILTGQDDNHPATTTTGTSFMMEGGKLVEYRADDQYVEENMRENGHVEEENGQERLDENGQVMLNENEPWKKDEDQYAADPNEEPVILADQSDSDSEPEEVQRLDRCLLGFLHRELISARLFKTAEALRDEIQAESIDFLSAPETKAKPPRLQDLVNAWNKFREMEAKESWNQRQLAKRRGEVFAGMDDDDLEVMTQAEYERRMDMAANPDNQYDEYQMANAMAAREELKSLDILRKIKQDRKKKKNNTGGGGNAYASYDNEQSATVRLASKNVASSMGIPDVTQKKKKKKKKVAAPSSLSGLPPASAETAEALAALVANAEQQKKDKEKRQAFAQTERKKAKPKIPKSTVPAVPAQVLPKWASNRGPWLPDEVDRLADAIRRHGLRDVRALANFVQTRSTKSVMRHMDKMKKGWSNADESKLFNVLRSQKPSFNKLLKVAPASKSERDMITWLEWYVLYSIAPAPVVKPAVAIGTAAPASMASTIKKQKAAAAAAAAAIPLINEDLADLANSQLENGDSHEIDLIGGQGTPKSTMLLMDDDNDDQHDLESLMGESWHGGAEGSPNAKRPRYDSIVSDSMFN